MCMLRRRRPQFDGCVCLWTGLPARGRGFGRPARGDHFRSRPPNTSRPPSLHVDDFVALEKRGEHPTGPTGYNGVPRLPARARVRAAQSAAPLFVFIGIYRFNLSDFSIFVP